ncbi:hypothetical protein [Saccharopolyspora oryzae]|uniref:Uncharacterized protein n=1 Tax=Saccharopolyspora oryzae TaxID=2997343 RepID=A0ABT4V2G6_9PSEU|nr:hypothetical protein [Saccharopolyspora oryzae]MDA3628148.1 hypothetical protein [Saccharopolyspora oryzae]
MDVFVWGAADTERAVRVLQAVRGFEALDGPVGSADLLGVRDGVLVELRHCDPGGLQVRFVDGTSPGRAAVVARSFLWMITRRGGVDEAMLVGPGAHGLRFRSGRIHRLEPLDSETVQDD